MEKLIKKIEGLLNFIETEEGKEEVTFVMDQDANQYEDVFLCGMDTLGEYIFKNFPEVVRLPAVVLTSSSGAGRQSNRKIKFSLSERKLRELQENQKEAEKLLQKFKTKKEHSMSGYMGIHTFPDCYTIRIFKPEEKEIKISFEKGEEVRSRYYTEGIVLTSEEMYQPPWKWVENEDSIIIMVQRSKLEHDKRNWYVAEEKWTICKADGLLKKEVTGKKWRVKTNRYGGISYGSR